MNAQPQAEHGWLEQLVGEWTFEMPSGPDQTAPPHTGAESVRSLAMWVLLEGSTVGPDGAPARTQMTLGYDPARGKFVGTFIASMMPNLWVYEGALDAGGKKLVLEAEGPSFTQPGKTARYKDTIEILSPDHRTLSSEYQADDGTWHPFMLAHYRRKG